MIAHGEAFRSAEGFPAPIAAPARLAITIGQHSIAGRKPDNQDFHGSLVPEGDLLAGKGVAFAVADGISTSALGAVAAETAVKSFFTDYFSTSEAWSVQVSAERVIAATNSWMYGQNLRGASILSDEERERAMVCTLSAMVIKSHTAHVFHIGDAHIARLANGVVEPLTEIHRINLGGGKSYLGRALGVNRHVEIDYGQISVQPNDIFILMTDGVYENVTGDEIAAAVMQSSDLDVAARRIVDEAFAVGSEDNLTVQLVRIDLLPDAGIADVMGGGTALPPAPRLEPGQDFEGYAILRELHSGSRSHVYLARDRVDGALVALKVPGTDHAEDQAHLQALLLEEWVARRVANTHVLKAAVQRGARSTIYSVTEYIEGRTLDEWMYDRCEVDLVAVRSVIKQIAAGLQALHRRAMIHRDLRPKNVIVDGDSTARIIDFGSVQVAGLDDVAPRADDGAFAGTMQYSAPELYLGAAATPLSDIFSLGVITYQMLTGKLPYGPRVAAATSRAAQRKLRYIPVTEINPAVPDWIDAAIARAVAIEPQQRYAELSEFIYDLAHPNPVLVGPDRWLIPVHRPERLWQAISLILLLLLVLTLWQVR